MVGRRRMQLKPSSAAMEASERRVENSLPSPRSPSSPPSRIVVGVKLRSECREMLTWIVAKLAQPGDQIVAVHVVRAFPDTDDILDSSIKQRLDSTFESVLGVYQSICNLKQVRLDIKVVSGASLQKALVESAKLEKASVLILGKSSKGCSESLVKYCTKRLPSSCLMIIVDHGQVLLGKEGLLSAPAKKEGPATVNTIKPYGQSKSDISLHCQEHQHAGWPLMNRSLSLEKSLEKVTPSRSISVVKWALQLPDRLKEAFDKQGGNMVRMLASSAMPDQLRHESSLPRLKGSPHAKHRGSPVKEVNTLSSSEDNNPRSLAASIQPSGQVSFSQKISRVCKDKACACFTFEELQEATSSFSPNNLVGKGGCSKVYRGTLSGGHVVAVKCLNQGATEADEELLTEVEILSTLNHPNIVGLIGYCVEGDTHILVYDFAAEGNLEENLHVGKDKPSLSWSQRHKIAVGAAEAFVYLHDTCARPVVHRDVKSSNILLRKNCKPQISDFGLAKWAPTSTTHITCSDVVGTLGYLAPEYFMFGRVSDKTDVYSFGVVLLELVTGRPPIDMSKPKGDENLVAWARPHLDCGGIEKLVDPRLEGNFDENQLRNMVVAATFCLRQSPQYRPRMARVLRLLCGEDSRIPSGRYDFTDEYLGEFKDQSNEVRKHLALAMMGVDDDVASQSSAEQNSIDLIHSEDPNEYLGGRSSSFDKPAKDQ
ncbi:serine/threonine-protein kinase PBS1 isoform X1 [Selaginella moellendorffii]|uniref:serine/threonine-protein kinase PBS1 isoform X1 n=1 Tax=Selaginella moellendorffii TaxID=88036 RepID=UPI000D1C973B|nr:serine/threonine-protein kinase PBS1 isoform X1 [Selaginella moellendorffii]|eukprot:XP_024524903.1 serine/threonine-protein kinase PBS1 isoform X1 [Selaginella moellendorffii]